MSIICITRYESHWYSQGKQSFVRHMFWDALYVREVIVTVVHNNLNWLGKSKLTYMKTCRCAACKKLPHSEAKSFVRHLLWDLPCVREGIAIVIYDNVHWLEKSKLTYMKIFRCAAGKELSRSQYQTIYTLRRQIRWQLLPDPRGVCFLSCFASGVGSCPVRAKIHEWGNHRIPFYSRSRCDWNSWWDPLSSGSLSILHRLLSGHNRHQRHLNHQGRLYKHHWWIGRTSKAQHSS